MAWTLNSYCQHLGYDGAVLVGPAQGPNAAYNWRCSRGGANYSIDVTAACRFQYGKPDAFAHATDLNDAYSWRCYAPSGPPPPPHKVYYPSDCFSEAYRPSRITVACGDGAEFVKRLHWSVWGAAHARGTGIFYINDCQPNCAGARSTSTRRTFAWTSQASARPRGSRNSSVFG